VNHRLLRWMFEYKQSSRSGAKFIIQTVTFAKFKHCKGLRLKIKNLNNLQVVKRRKALVFIVFLQHCEE
jgi:hypothetical protein